MAQALSAPFLVTALVLCAAGVAKLRSPTGAARALAVAGLPAGVGLVRAFAGGELALGTWSLLHPSPRSAAGVASVYAGFCVLALVLARRRAACGCFGDGDAPASVVHSVLSGTLGLVAVAAAIAQAHGIGWILGSGVARAGVLTVGIAGSAYAIVLAYTHLPQAWSAWSPR